MRAAAKYVLLFSLAGCSMGSARNEPVELPKPHAPTVSFVELLANPASYHGQVVQVVGVAEIDLGFEGITAIFLSFSDRKYFTNEVILLGELDGYASSTASELEAMSGKYVVVEGRFTYHPPPVSELGNLVICVGLCFPHRLDDIQRVEVWPAMLVE